MPTQADHSSRDRIVLAVVVAFVIVCALGWFMNANSERIMAQNAQYLESSTSQSVLRIDEALDNAQMSVRSVAQIYEDNLTAPVVDPDDMTSLVADTPFDYFLFCAPDGTVYAEGEAPRDASDREYYRRGMLGHSGVCDVELSIFDDQNVLVFYAPVRYDGQILGVLAGVLNQYTITDILTTYFFGTRTSTYLCKSDGTIVGESATYATASRIPNLFDIFNDADFGYSISREDFVEAFATGTYISFTYSGTAGTGIANAMALPSRDWVLVRTFPSAITAEMVSHANQAGVALAVAVACALVAFIVVTLVQSLRVRKRLQQENSRATSIIDASANLFQRLVVADFATNTYEYVRADGGLGDLPRQGEYNMLRYYWHDRIVDEADRRRMDDALRSESIGDALADGRPFLQYDYRVLGERPGETAWLRISVVPLKRYDNGYVESVLMAVQDVTETKHREMEQHLALEDALRVAEQASKAKSDFLNNMSHDIRTPMNSIMGLTALAQMNIDDPAQVQDCLAKISTASRHLLGLINEVLDMAKIESGSFHLSEEPFSLTETIEGLLSIMTPQINDKKQELKVSVSPIEHDRVIGDPMRLQQVFVNIMGNSVKFTPMGGTIELSIAEIPSKLPGHACFRFVFADTGCGMSEEFMEHIFEPFVRANDTRVTSVQGTGLGMPIVRNMVTMMNGTVDVDSTLGEGTTFTVTVFLKLTGGTPGGDVRTQDAPEAAAPDADAPMSESELLAACDLAGRRVLLVEDNSLAAGIAEDLLRTAGLDVVHAENGRAAVDMLAASDPGTFDLVLMDIQMPLMNGYEATKAIRAMGSDARPDLAELPIVALTADAFNDDVERARTAGMNAHMSKPLEIPVLVETLNTWIGGAR